MPAALSTGNISFGDGFAAETGTRSQGVTERASQKAAYLHNRRHELGQLHAGGESAKDRGFKLTPGPIWDPTTVPWDVDPSALYPKEYRRGHALPSVKLAAQKEGGGAMPTMLGADPATWSPQADHHYDRQLCHQKHLDIAEHAPFLRGEHDLSGSGLPAWMKKGLPSITRRLPKAPLNVNKLLDSVKGPGTPSESLLRKIALAEAAAELTGYEADPRLKTAVELVKFMAQRHPDKVDNAYGNLYTMSV